MELDVGVDSGNVIGVGGRRRSGAGRERSANETTHELFKAWDCYLRAFAKEHGLPLEEVRALIFHLMVVLDGCAGVCDITPGVDLVVSDGGWTDEEYENNRRWCETHGHDWDRRGTNLSAVEGSQGAWAAWCLRRGVED